MLDAKPIGIKELRRQLEDAAARGTDPQPALRQAADDFRRAESNYLARVRWAPLDPQYAAWKARNGYGTRPGVLTGGLLDSLTKEGDRYHFERVTADRLEVGTKNPVARLFDKGTKRQPKRKLVKLTVRDRRAMLTAIRDHLLGPLG
jgi:hypothetical protein